MDEKAAEASAVIGDLLSAATSAIPLVGGPLAGVSQAITNRKTRKRIAFLERLCEELIDRVDSLEGILRDTDYQEMLLDAVQEAGTISDGEPFELLVRIVADGLQLSDPDQVRRVRLYMDIVSQLRPEHIRLLRELGTVTDTPAVFVLHMAQKWTIYALENRLPELSEAIDPLLARVVGLGLAYQTGSVSTDTPGRAAPQAQWGLTKFGLNLMRFLYGHDQPDQFTESKIGGA
jgi:hypothetical protein